MKHLVNVVRDSLYLRINTDVRFDKVNFCFEEKDSEGNWNVCWPKEAYINTVFKNVRKLSTSEKVQNKVSKDIWDSLKKSTKYCPECFSDRLSFFGGSNEKQCLDCNHIFKWPLEEGQLPLAANNRLKYKTK